MDCNPPGCSVHGIFQARILEWVAISYSQGIFLTQRLNPCLLSPLQWQTDSLPLTSPGKSPQNHGHGCKFMVSVRKTCSFMALCDEPLWLHYLMNKTWWGDLFSFFSGFYKCFSQIPLPTPSLHTSLGNLLSFAFD